jgi:hypothetical protein
MKRMARHVSVLVLSLVAFSAIGIGAMHLRKDEQKQHEQRTVAPSRATSSERAMVRTLANEQQLMADEAAPADEPAVLSADETARAITQTESGDATTRATGILALASAPKAEAVPTLRRVLEGGEPSVDRPLALRSLRDLALYQGDDDGTIRGVVRETIYHGDDDALIEGARLALEIIEESELE